MSKKIDKNYFFNYGAEGVDYNKEFLDHSTIPKTLGHFISAEIQLNTICILGAATGVANEYIHEEFNIIPSGCEFNKWAYMQIKPLYKESVYFGDLRKYLKLLRKCKIKQDLIYTNAFQYLPKDQIVDVLWDAFHICNFISISVPEYETDVVDPYRTFCEPYTWWNSQLKHARFTPTKTKWIWRKI